MARKYGNVKNKRLNVWDWTLGLAGYSGSGKTQLVNEFCQILFKDDIDQYLHFNIGEENGASYLELLDQPVVDIQSWDKLEDVISDIEENRISEYSDLKMVVWDTMDELFKLAEIEAIRRYNKANPAKRAKTLKQCGYGIQDAVMNLVTSTLFRLIRIKINPFVIMHTKTKDKEDVITGKTYQVLTSKMQQNYYEAIKTKIDVIGVVYVDREITTESLDKKLITGENKVRNIISQEARKISFRSNTFSMDSKSRLPEIIDEISMNPSEFISAVSDAIQAGKNKSKKSEEELQNEAKEQELAAMKKLAEKEVILRNKKELELLLEEIKAYIGDNKTDMSKIKPIIAIATDNNFSNPLEVDDIKVAKAMLKACK